MGGPENVKRDQDLEKEPPRQGENPHGGSTSGNAQVKKNINKVIAETRKKSGGLFS